MRTTSDHDTLADFRYTPAVVSEAYNKSINLPAINLIPAARV